MSKPGFWVSLTITFNITFNLFALDISKCNGHESLCNKTLLEVSLASSHNSMSNQEFDWVAPDHLYGITTQLNFGIRALSIDVWPHKHSVYMCHKRCTLGKKYLFDGLLEIRDFMKQNPNEVIIIFFETYVSNLDLAKMITEVDLEQYVYIHDANTGWPTLRNMITNNQKLVILSDRGEFSDTPSWLHNAYDLAHFTGPVWEKNANGNLDRDQLSCWVEPILENPEKLYWLNHFGLAPYTLQRLSESINYQPFLGNRALNCWEEAQHIPNMLSITFYSKSDLIEVINQLNGINQ